MTYQLLCQAMTTPLAVRLEYAALRDLGAPRPEAARLAGISYRTARRLDEKCVHCGEPIERKDSDAGVPPV